jgi:DNA-directed RNA polymerase specialized sigma24 family protein
MAHKSTLELDCFHGCLNGLPDEQRSLILSYYEGERSGKIENRQELAAELKIPLNALRIRAHRIRRTIEDCIGKCTENAAMK